MQQSTRFTVTVALIVALGGFLMGFDASVISGVVGFIETEFQLSKIELGWSVSSLALTATLAMMVAGPISDRIGRRPVLMLAAVLFAASAIASALAPNFFLLVLARMVGGLGVGAALIIAPMYIAEIAPAEVRGRMVSFNQLNIVIGISAAFFSNYLILTLGQSDLAWAESLRLADWSWRWMLGIETLPAILYFVALFIVPESPRWLAMNGREDEALAVLVKVSSPEQARADLKEVHNSVAAEAAGSGVKLGALFHPSMKLVLTIGVSVGILQQLTGINSVFFYSPMIFEQSGIGTNAAFMQAVLVGLVNLVFTIAAMALIDKLGRRPLLGFGLGGIAICMLTLAYGFGAATYTLDQDAIKQLPAEISTAEILTVQDVTYESDIDFREAISAAVGADVYKQYESAFVSNAIDMNPLLILFAILGFVASFAISIGPIMWVLFSELFPNRVRGMAISFVGLINSAVAFLVTFIFPWELENFGNAATFLIYGVIAVIGLVLVMRILPETKGSSLEELEKILVRH
ncbi:MAG: sugar porter family MFS transporter [Gammaproteobacteria bacterium]|nr:sugar porter family MFS transporter [Gammaproteobacteria bacterium]